MRQPSGSSWLAFLAHESNTTHCVNEPRPSFAVDLFPKTRHLNINHVVERGRAAWLFPHFARKHLARDERPLMPKQVLEELELANRQVQVSTAADSAPRHHVE